MIALEEGGFSVCGVTQVRWDAQPREDGLGGPQLQLSHRVSRRETSLSPGCDPCLILPEKGSKSTGSPANTPRRGRIPLGLSGGRDEMGTASVEVQHADSSRIADSCIPSLPESWAWG